MNNESITRLLCDILREIAEAVSAMEVYESDAGTLHLPEFRYIPSFEFTDEDIQLIKEIAESEGEDFSTLTE